MTTEEKLRNILDEYDSEVIDLRAVLDLERSIVALIRDERRAAKREERERCAKVAAAYHLECFCDDEEQPCDGCRAAAQIEGHIRALKDEE